MVVELLSSEVRVPGLISTLQYLLSLCLSLPICRMVLEKIAKRVAMRIKWGNIRKAPGTVHGTYASKM